MYLASDGKAVTQAFWVIMLQIWFMLIFDRPKKTHKPRTWPTLFPTNIFCLDAKYKVQILKDSNCTYLSPIQFFATPKTNWPLGSSSKRERSGDRILSQSYWCSKVNPVMELQKLC